MKRWRKGRLLPLLLSAALVFTALPEVVHAAGITQDQAVAWINNQIGRKIDLDGNGVWCVDLIANYFDIFGVARIWGNASEYAYMNPPSGWQRIQGAQIQAGDIVIWTGGGYGHVALAVSGSEVVEQNYGVLECAKHPMVDSRSNRYQSNGYWGVWRPNFVSPLPPEPERGQEMSGPFAHPVSDGDYYIVSALEGDKYQPGTKCLGAYGMPANKNISGANAELQTINGSLDQVYTVTWIDAGQGYKIKLKNSDDQWLDVAYANTEVGANVQHHDGPGIAKQWVISECGDDGGGYRIQARCSGYYLDVSDANTADGTNIQLYRGNGSNAQRWYLIPWGGGNSAVQSIPDGEYEIVSKLDSGKVLSTNGTKITLQSRGSDERHIFRTTYLGQGYYKITNKNTGKVLDVAYAESKRGALPILADYWNSYNEQFLIKDCGGGDYQIISRCNGLCVDIADGVANEGQEIHLWSYEGLDNQVWTFVPCRKLKLNAPTASIASGRTVEKNTYVMLDKGGADTLYFTIDGTDPKTSVSRQAYAGTYANRGICIDKAMTIKAYGTKSGYEDSDVAAFAYNVKENADGAETGGSGDGDSDTDGSGDDDSGMGSTGDGGSGTSGSGGGSSGIETPAIKDEDDPQDGVRWHYSESKMSHRDLSQYGQIAGNIKAKVYDGSPYRPAVKVIVKDANGKTVTLTEGLDYRLLYYNNMHAGTGRVVVKGNGIYRGSLTKEFMITKKPAKQLKVIADSLPVGSALKPNVYVYDGARRLTEGADYTLSETAGLASSKGKKKVTVTATAASDYQGSLSAAVTIYAPNLKRTIGVIGPDAEISLLQTDFQYNAKAHTPQAAVRVNGQTLEKNKHYIIKYMNNKNVGTAYAIISGKGGYVGSVVKAFTISPASDKQFALKKQIAPVTYNGRLQRPRITVTADGRTLCLNKDYTVVYNNNLHATDSAKVTVRGKGNYANMQPAVFTFTIKPCSIKKVSVKADKQGTLLVKYANHTLVEGEDYTVSYGTADKRGRIPVTVKAAAGGSFTGETMPKKLMVTPGIR